MNLDKRVDELTFEKEQEITEILEGYRNNPSNSNKFRFELFAYINSLIEESNTEAQHLHQFRDETPYDCIYCKLRVGELQQKTLNKRGQEDD